MLKLVAGLVIFPFMGVAAALHGVGIVLMWVLRNIYMVLGFPVFSPTVTRIWSARIKDEGDKFAPWLASGMYLACLAMFVAIGAGTERNFFMNNWLAITIVPALNLLSGLYEGGRAYFGWLTAKKQDEPADEEPKSDEPDDFMGMLEAIQEMDSISKEGAKKLLERIVELLKQDKIDQQQLMTLTNRVYERVTEKISETAA